MYSKAFSPALFFVTVILSCKTVHSKPYANPLSAEQIQIVWNCRGYQLPASEISTKKIGKAIQILLLKKTPSDQDGDQAERSTNPWFAEIHYGMPEKNDRVIKQIPISVWESPELVTVQSKGPMFHLAIQSAVYAEPLVDASYVARAFIDQGDGSDDDLSSIDVHMLRCRVGEWVESWEIPNAMAFDNVMSPSVFEELITGIPQNYEGTSLIAFDVNGKALELSSNPLLVEMFIAGDPQDSEKRTFCYQGDRTIAKKVLRDAVDRFNAQGSREGDPDIEIVTLGLDADHAHIDLAVRHSLWDMELGDYKMSDHEWKIFPCDPSESSK